MIFFEDNIKNKILIKNKYYRDGLLEKTVLHYYLKNKKEILKEINNRPIVLVICTDVNTFVFKRKDENELIFLNNKNYEHYIKDRVISLFVELGSPTNLWCIDIDPGSKVPESKLKNAVGDAVGFFENLEEMGWLKRNGIRVISTSSGYHVFGTMKRKDTYENNLQNILYFLEPYSKKYTINKRRTNENEIIFDLAVMRRRGCHVVPYSLNRNGLICTDVTNNWPWFKKQQSILKENFYEG